MPVIMSFDNPEYSAFLHDNYFCAAVMCIVSLLMVSRIPTISTKKWRVPSYMFVPMMLLVVLFVSFIISTPWLTLGTMVCLYALSIPLGVFYFLKLKHEAEAKK